MGPGTEGVWVPRAVNECLKIGRYSPGCHFSPHIDGPWVRHFTFYLDLAENANPSALCMKAPAPDHCSIYSVVIYLNDHRSHPVSFQGGHTNFLRPPSGALTPMG